MDAAASKGSNIHLIGCTSSSGYLQRKIKRGPSKKKKVQEWVKSRLNTAQGIFNHPVVLVIDNSPAHTALESVL